MSKLDGPHVVFLPAELSDYESFVLLSKELGTDDPVPHRDKWWREMAPTTFFMRSGSDVVGYAYFNHLDDVGYVRHVAIAPGYRGKGLGHLLMDELARRFREAGATEWCLNVKPGNAPAIHLYRSVGLLHAHSSCALRLSWDLVGKLPASQDVAAAQVQPRDDAAIERRFGLAAGHIADLRARTKRTLLWLSAAGEPAGFAAFDADYPGAFPFRVEAAHARSLLEAMRPFAKPTDTEVQVVVENDPLLAQTLLGAGARLKMEFDHYRGPIPQGAARRV